METMKTYDTGHRPSVQNEDQFRSLLSIEGLSHLSDLYFLDTQTIRMRIDGRLQDTGEMATAAFIRWLLSTALSERQQDEFLRNDVDIDFSWVFDGHRFRGNAYHAQESPAVVLRLLPDVIPALSDIQPLTAWNRLFSISQGLILVCGRTGSGKSTTIASFIEELGRRRSLHILTLEDPIEYIFSKDNSLISQRELGHDFSSFPFALRSALREMPDILFIGEIRDKETMQAALMAAESGILVLSTLHTMGAAEAILRMEGFFPAEERDSIRSQAAATLQAIFSQQLIEGKDGDRVSCTEVLLRTPATANLLRQGKYTQLTSSMMSQKAIGMQTMDMALDDLYRQGKISHGTYHENKTGATME